MREDRKERNGRKSDFWFALIAAFMLAAPVVLCLAQPALAAGAPPGDFYIITSVNHRKHELFVKTPSEVTELMKVDDQTAFLDEQAKKISFADLRAGDTVYLVSRQEKEMPLAV